MRIIWTAVLTCVWLADALAAGEWPQFRGPRGDGHSAAQNLPTTWGGFLEPPVWQTSLAGAGWSSPIVWGDRIWVTAAEQTALTADVLAERQAQLPYGEEEFQARALPGRYRREARRRV